MYRHVFPEPEYEPLSHDRNAGDKIDYRKIYKIKYSVNLLPQIGPHYLYDEDRLRYLNDDVPLIDLCIDNDELEKYDTETMQELIQYKWNVYGRKHHLMGCIMHLFNTAVIIAYVCLSYLREPEEDEGNIIPILLAIGVAYPAFYEFFQLYKVGTRSYFVSFWNYADIVNIILSLINIYMQLMVGPYEIQCRIIMCLMVVNITSKTFFFLRIFPSLTPIVVMI